MRTIGDGRSSVHARLRSFSHGHMSSQWQLLVLFRALTARIPTTISLCHVQPGVSCRNAGNVDEHNSFMHLEMYPVGLRVQG
jgi:hypothetical protein